MVLFNRRQQRFRLDVVAGLDRGLEFAEIGQEALHLGAIVGHKLLLLVGRNQFFPLRLELRRSLGMFADDRDLLQRILILGSILDLTAKAAEGAAHFFHMLAQLGLGLLARVLRLNAEHSGHGTNNRDGEKTDFHEFG